LRSSSAFKCSPAAFEVCSSNYLAGLKQVPKSSRCASCAPREILKTLPVLKVVMLALDTNSTRVEKQKQSHTCSFLKKPLQPRPSERQQYSLVRQAPRKNADIETRIYSRNRQKELMVSREVLPYFEGALPLAFSSRTPSRHRRRSDERDAFNIQSRRFQASCRIERGVTAGLM